jgi:sugar phosphate isomerase/epimerase
MENLLWLPLAGLLFIASAAAGEPAETAPGRLAFTAAGKEYRFDTGVLRGTLREGGKSLGIKPMLEGTADTPVAGAFGLLSPYRLLTADARFGTAAWEWESESKLLPDGAVEVRWLPNPDHPLEMTGVYRWAAPNTLDLQLTVKPRQDLRRFELFLASYFDGFPASFAYVKENPDGGGRPGFMEARKAGGDWQTFPLGEETAAIFGDGRWNRPPHPVAWKIMPRLAAPLAMRRDAKTSLTAVLMARPEDCFAVSMPYGEEGHRSVYLSLFGRDLKAGEGACARARLVVGREITDAQALALYQTFGQAANAPRAQANPFFAFCMDTHDSKKRTLGQQAQLLKELGYDGAGHLWLDHVPERLKTLDDAGLRLFQVYVRLNVAPDAKPPYDARLKDLLPLLKGRATMLAVLGSGGKPSDVSGDERAVALLREIADLAQPHGIRLALYPHMGDWLEKMDDAIRVAKKVDRPNVGVMFNLCHFLKVDDSGSIKPLLEKAGPLLMAVSINGSDDSADLRAGKGKWIVPLDEGRFDLLGLLKTLRGLGYTGPVGLQCWGIGGDAREHLLRSMNAWRQLNERLAEPNAP